MRGTGYAIGAGVNFLLPSLGKGDYFIIQGIYGVGAANYTGSNWGNGGVGALLLQNGFPVVTNSAIGPVFDGIYNAATGGIDNTKSWSVTGGFEHRWDPKWKTSLYGAYGTYQYDAFASAVIAAPSVRCPGGISLPGRRGRSAPAPCGRRLRTSI